MIDRRPQGTHRHKSSGERWRERWESFSGQNGGSAGGPSLRKLLLKAALPLLAFFAFVFTIYGKPFMGGDDIGLLDAVFIAALILPIALITKWFR